MDEFIECHPALVAVALFGLPALAFFASTAILAVLA